MKALLNSQKTAVLLKVRKGQMILRALNHKLRQQILNIIEDKPNITVTEIYNKLKIEQSVASQHLAILRNSDIVTTTRDGKFIKYNVNHDRINDIEAFVDQLLK
jgi:DNA-binding transcriptional ArsR family regulator